jgi:hypothetical protein
VRKIILSGNPWWKTRKFCLLTLSRTLHFNCGRELKSICMTRKTENWHYGTNESKYAEANMLIGNGDV